METFIEAFILTVGIGVIIIIVLLATGILTKDK